MEEYKVLIDKFCDLNKQKKRNEIKNEIQEVLVLFKKLCEDKGIKNQLLLHTEMNNFENENMTEDEFLNAIYAYIISMENSIGNYLQNQ